MDKNNFELKCRQVDENNQKLDDFVNRVIDSIEAGTLDSHASLSLNLENMRFCSYCCDTPSTSIGYDDDEIHIGDVHRKFVLDYDGEEVDFEEVRSAVVDLLQDLKTMYNEDHIVYAVDHIC